MDRVKIERLIAEEEQKLKVLTERAKEYDPFWYWIPNEGRVTDEGREVLAKYLKPEDIPDTVNGQTDRLLSKTEINGTSGGNRSGKTEVETIDGYIKATGELPNSLKHYESHFGDVIRRAKSKVVMGRVTAVDNKQLHRVVLAAWQKYAPKQYLKGNDWDKSYSKEFDILTLYRGGKICSKVEFMTNEQAVKSAQGNDLDWAKFDEEPDRDKWKETLMRFGTSDKLDASIAWTPTEGLTWATELFHNGVVDNEEIKNSTSLFKFTPVSNPYVNKETLIKIMDEFAKVSTYDEMRMRLLGDAISLSGLIYSGLFNKRTHVIKPFKIDHHKYMVYRGLDPHLVKPTVCVEMAVDRDGFEYVIGTYSKVADTAEIKKDLWQRAEDNRYRLGRTVCDKSADSDIEILKRNIYKELSTGKHAIPALVRSEKFDGSIKAGVDQMKQLLKSDPNNTVEALRKPRLYIFDIPENQLLIKAFQTLERDTYNNEDKKGIKDRIAEGKHDAHACLRYIHQTRVVWLPKTEFKPQPQMEECYV